MEVIEKVLSPEELLEKHIGLAYWITGRFFRRRYTIEYNLLLSEALLTLWGCCNKYNQDMNNTFSTYAIVALKRSLNRLLEEEYDYRNNFLTNKNEFIRHKVNTQNINMKHNEYDLDLLDKALYEITPDQKIALILRSKGMKFREINPQLGVTKQAVCYNYQAGIRNLKKHLGVE